MCVQIPDLGFYLSNKAVDLKYRRRVLYVAVIVISTCSAAPSRSWRRAISHTVRSNPRVNPVSFSPRIAPFRSKQYYKIWEFAEHRRVRIPSLGYIRGKLALEPKVIKKFDWCNGSVPDIFDVNRPRNYLQQFIGKFRSKKLRLNKIQDKIVSSF